MKIKKNCRYRLLTNKKLYQYSKIVKKKVYSMLSTSEDMTYYLRTAYGGSKNFRGHKIAVKFQGLWQGNGAAPADWAVISIVIIRGHKKKGQGAFCLSNLLLNRSPVSNLFLWITTTSSMLTWERTSQQMRPRTTCNAALIAGVSF